MESKLTCSGCAPAHATETVRDGIGRRTFLAQSALLAAGALLAACAGGDVTDPGTTITSTTDIAVSDFPALASVGGIALVNFSATGQWQGGERTSSMRSYATSYNAAAGTITIG
jgi:ABC-type glycerol-3-phosphate transport system substrate-binding protein